MITEPIFFVLEPVYPMGSPDIWFLPAPWFPQELQFRVVVPAGIAGVMQWTTITDGGDPVFKSQVSVLPLDTLTLTAQTLIAFNKL